MQKIRKRARDIPAATMDIKSARIRSQASMLMLKSIPDAMGKASAQLLEPPLSLDEGPVSLRSYGHFRIDRPRAN